MKRLTLLLPLMLLLVTITLSIGPLQASSKTQIPKTLDIPEDHLIPDGEKYYYIKKENMARITSIPPSSTIKNENWIVNTTEVIRDETIILNGNLTIQQTGNLTMINTTLIINCTKPGEHKVEVNGGIMLILNSTIKAYNTSNNYIFQVKKGSNFILINSKINNCGVLKQDYTGLHILADNVTIINSKFSNNLDSLIIINVTNIVIRNSLFKDNFVAMRIHDSKNIEIINCTFKNNISGLLVGYSKNMVIKNCIIESNTISNYVGYGMHIVVSKNVLIENCTIKNNLWEGLLWGESYNVTIRNNKFINDGIILYGFNLTNYLSLKVVNNTVNGKPIGYFVNITDKEIENPNKYAQIFLINSRNITINGFNASDTVVGIQLCFANNTKILNSNFINNTKGIKFIATNNVLVNNCYFDKNIYAFISFGEKNVVNRFTKILNNRIVLTYPSRRMEITGWTSSGVILDGLNHIISNNYIYNVSWTGINCRNVRYCIIRDNVINDCNENGIWLGFSNSNNITNNIIEGCKYGISLWKTNGLSILNNNISNTIHQGIIIQHSNNITISQNRIDSSIFDQGLWTWNSTFIFIDNYVFDNNHAGIFLDGGSIAEILNNTFSNNGASGIELYGGSYGYIENNVVVDNDHAGVWICESQADLIRNEIYNNAWGGVELHHSNDNHIFNNKIYMNGFGMMLDNSSNNLIFNNVIGLHDGLKGVSETDWNVTWYEVLNSSGVFGDVIGASEFPFIFYHDPEGIPGHYDHVGFIARAKITLDEDQTVWFQIGSDDGSKLFVDGELVLDLWGLHGYEDNITCIELSRGEHDLEMWWYEWEGESSASFYAWTIWPNSIEIWSSQNNTLYNNTITLNKNGVIITNSRNCTLIENDIIEIYGGDSISVGESENISLIGNNIYDGWLAGVATVNSRNCILKQNNITSNRGVGIWIYNSTDQIISNRFTSNSGGMDVIESKYGLISNNYIFNNTSYGIHLYNSSNVIIQGNYIVNNTYGICNEVCGNEAHYNLIEGNREYGVWSDVLFNATYNWWGDPSGPYHPTSNPSGLGDRVSDNVLFDPWLSSPYCTLVLNLYEGWNLIGISLESNASSIRGIFGDSLSYVEAIFGYVNGSWSYWISGLPSTLEALEPGYGYWVKVDRPIAITLAGLPAFMPSTRSGWNLIAIPGVGAVSTVEYLNEHYPDWGKVFYYDAESRSWSYYIRGLGGDLITLEPGKGYWLYIEGD